MKAACIGPRSSGCTSAAGARPSISAGATAQQRARRRAGETDAAVGGMAGDQIHRIVGQETVHRRAFGGGHGRRRAGDPAPRPPPAPPAPAPPAPRRHRFPTSGKVRREAGNTSAACMPATTSSATPAATPARTTESGRPPAPLPRAPARTTPPAAKSPRRSAPPDNRSGRRTGSARPAPARPAECGSKPSKASRAGASSPAIATISAVSGRPARHDKSQRQGRAYAGLGRLHGDKQPARGTRMSKKVLSVINLPIPA